MPCVGLSRGQAYSSTPEFYPCWPQLVRAIDRHSTARAIFPQALLFREASAPHKTPYRPQLPPGILRELGGFPQTPFFHPFQPPCHRRTNLRLLYAFQEHQLCSFMGHPQKEVSPSVRHCAPRCGIFHAYPQAPGSTTRPYDRQLSPGPWPQFSCAWPSRRPDLP